MYQLPDTASWQPRQPCLPEIVALCEKFFSWGSSGDIVSRFKNSLWPGIAIQHLLQVRNKSFIQFVRADTILIQRPTVDEYLAQYASEDIIPGPEQLTIHVLQICRARLGPGARSMHPDVIGYTIQISTHGVIHETALGLDSDSRSLTLAQESVCAKTSFWIPGSILRVTLPKLVKRFTGKKAIPPIGNYSPVSHFYMFLIHTYKPSPYRFFPLYRNLHSKKINYCCTSNHPLAIPPISISS